MEKPSVAFNPLPNSLPLQGKRALAGHPRRVFGSREKGKKMKESGERGKQRANCRPLSIAKSEVINSRFVQTKAYIGAQCIGNYQKKKTKLKAITRIKWEETRNCNKKTKASKAGEQCCRGE